MNVHTLLFAELTTRAQSAALQDNSQTYRYADIERESARCAAFLTGLGAAPGDRVAVQMLPTPQAILVYLGALRAGLVCVPISSTASEVEIESIIECTEPRVIVLKPDAPVATHSAVYTLADDGSGTLRDTITALPSDSAFNTVERADDEVALILFTAGTTGTTGRPKGAMLTHGNLAANAAALRNVWRLSEDDVVLPALPLHYYFGLCAAIHPALLAGATLALQPPLDGDALVGSLRKTTLLIGEPAFYERLLQEPDLNHAACDSIRLCISGAAPLHRDTWTAFHERTGKAILECYGLPEAGMAAFLPLGGGGGVFLAGGGVSLPLSAAFLAGAPFCSGVCVAAGGGGGEGTRRQQRGARNAKARHAPWAAAACRCRCCWPPSCPAACRRASARENEEGGRVGTEGAAAAAAATAMAGGVRRGGAPWAAAGCPSRTRRPSWQRASA